MRHTLPACLCMLLSLFVPAAFLSAQYQGNQMLRDSTLPAIAQQGFGLALHGNDLLTGGVAAGVVAYRYTGANWVSVPVPSVPLAELAGYGFDLDLEGDYAVIGDQYRPLHRETDTVYSVGAVWIYRKNSSGAWEVHQKITAPEGDQQYDDRFGMSVSMSGNFIAIGTVFEDLDANFSNPVNGAGAVYIFERGENGLYQFQQKIVSPNRNATWFGHSLDLDGDHLVVSHFNNGFDENEQNKLSYAGSVYYFRRNALNVWEYRQKIVDPMRLSGDQFGNDVSLDQHTLVIGSCDSRDQNEESPLLNAGAAFVYELNDSLKWEFAQKLIPIERGYYELFGNVVAVDGDRILVGSPGDDHDIPYNYKHEGGSITVFERTCTGTWSELQKIIPDTTVSNGQFGARVAIAGYHAAGAAPFFPHILQSGDTLAYLGAIFPYTTCTDHVTRKISSCEAYNFNETVLTESGTYSDTLRNQMGCDSVVCLQFNYGVTSTTIDTVGCGELLSPSGRYLFTQDGIYRDTLPGACDSVLEIHLKLVQLDNSVSNNANQLEAGQTGASYRWVDCAGMATIPGEEQKTFSPVANGSYAVEISAAGCTVLSPCVEVTTIGIAERNFAGIRVYPNPAGSQLHISVPGKASPYGFRVCDLRGRVITSGQLPAGEAILNVGGLAPGAYLLSLSGYDGNHTLIFHKQ